MGLIMSASSGGLDPKCTAELIIARLVWPFAFTVPTKFADLNPDTEFINAARRRGSIALISDD
jgi:hypothetical protein